MFAGQIFSKFNRLVLVGCAAATAMIFFYALVFGRLGANFWPFRCDARGYGPETFLAYCGDPAYGDYEHAALYFATEPGIAENLSRARVLFVGGSRARRAFSSRTTDRFFARLGVPYFNLAFGYQEQDVFFQRMIDFRRLTPNVVVASVDGFFTGSASVIGKEVLARARAGEGAGPEIRLKNWIQPIHAKICGTRENTVAAILCGQRVTLFRSVRNGQTIYFNITDNRVPVKYTLAFSALRYETRLRNARRFRDFLRNRGACLVLTEVPHAATAPEIGRRLAEALDVPFLMPRLTALVGVDGNHLNQPSAERWTAAFLAELDPVLTRCLTKSGDKRP